MTKLKGQLMLGTIGLVLIIIFFCVKRIDAGHAGIKVNNYGDDKGVSTIVEVTGWTFYNFISQKVFEIPTYVQTANYINDTVNGINNELRFNTKDGMVVRINTSLNYNTPTESVVRIFKKYRKPVQELEHTILRNKIVDAINSICSNYNCEEVYEKRNKFEAECKKKLRETLGKEGFVVEDFVILGELRLPPTVVHNINLKVSATQITLTKQQEVQQFFFESQKSIVKSRGDSAVTMLNATAKANAIRANADAEAYANDKINNSITDRLIKYNQTNNWDGHLNHTLMVGSKNDVMLPLDNK